MDEAVLAIGELARLTGVEASALRRWERDYGLFSPRRSAGGQRRYSNADVARVAEVLGLVETGWSRAAAARAVAGRRAAPAVADGSDQDAVGVGRAAAASRDLARQLEFHGRLLDAVGEAVVAFDRAGYVRYWSPSAQRLFGWSAETVLGLDIRSFAPPDVVESMSEATARALEGERSAHEVRASRPDGTVLDVMLTLSPFTDADGELAGVIALGVDITDRKRAEDEARERAAHSEVVAALTQWALAGHDVDRLLEQAAVGVSRALEAEHVAIVEAVPGSDELRVRAALGAGAGSGGRLSRPFRSHAAFTITSRRPVVVEDFETEPRFDRGPLSGERSAASGLCVPIQGDAEMLGALCVHAAALRSYTSSEVTFLQSVANVCGLALHGGRMQARIQALAEAR